MKKIAQLQAKVNTREFPLVKSEVEDIRKMINDIPYEKERKLFFKEINSTITINQEVIRWYLIL